VGNLRQSKFHKLLWFEILFLSKNRKLNKIGEAQEFNFCAFFYFLLPLKKGSGVV
jgi:hypothetical protein